MGSEPGIDPYTRVVSDVYQDLFDEGSFIGKGIYDVDTFEQVLKDRLPENLILSHDLVEGSHARAGLLSDVLLYEDYPARYVMDVSRRHRWIRGDWQIARWLLPGVPGLDGKRRKNSISILSRWKIFDNLRRSLVPAGLIVLLLLAWAILSPAYLWTLAAMGAILIPPGMAAFLDLFQKPVDVRLNQHLAFTLRSAGRRWVQAAFLLICLPHEAFFSLDAIWRTAWRMGVSRKRLLEWNTTKNTERQNRTDLAASWRLMWFAPLLATASAIYLSVSRPMTLPVAAPILILWFVSPIIVWWISRPSPLRQVRLTVNQTLFLHQVARKTWAFFETFVGPEDHWLPPDNYQEHPLAVVAHRTSPTNMGLALLANLSAYDFGYLCAEQLIDRTAKAFQAMGAMERHRGHFYNWYDTLTLKPLLPLYISSVDSGNLAGHLLTLRSGLLELIDHKIVRRCLFQGLGDTLAIVADTASAAEEERLGPYFVELKQDLRSAIDSPPASLTASRQCIDRLATSAAALVAGVEALDSGAESQLTWWTRAFADQCRAAAVELSLLAPWTDILSSQGSLAGFPDLDEIPTLALVAALDTVFPQDSRQPLDAAEPSEQSSRRDELRIRLISARRIAIERIAAIEELARQCITFAAMDYAFLFDEKRHLLAIGYHVGDHRLDPGYYDLLASEARLASFVAIAQGQLPQENWFALGRLLTIAGGEPILLSWSGSMFEYLMPLLVMPTYEGTLLDQTYIAAVDRQIEYGKKRTVPWGISESGYNTIDAALNYQYRAFGVPGLGLKRGTDRRPGDCALCHGVGADGGTRSGVFESPTSCRHGPGNPIRLL